MTAKEIYIKHGCAFVAGTSDEHFLAAMEEHAQLKVAEYKKEITDKITTITHKVT